MISFVLHNKKKLCMSVIRNGEQAYTGFLYFVNQPISIS